MNHENGWPNMKNREATASHARTNVWYRIHIAPKLTPNACVMISLVDDRVSSEASISTIKKYQPHAFSIFHSGYAQQSRGWVS